MGKRLAEAMEGKTRGCRLLVLLLISLCCLVVQRYGVAAKNSCETCHTDKIALKNSLSLLPPRSGEEEES
jgi:hypothetical protein